MKRCYKLEYVYKFSAQFQKWFDKQNYEILTQDCKELTLLIEPSQLEVLLDKMLDQKHSGIKLIGIKEIK